MAEVRTRLRQLAGLFPLTTTGFVTLLASGLAFAWLGLQREDRILVVVGAAGGLLFAAMLLLTVLGTVVVWRRARTTITPPVRLVVGTPAPTGFVLATPLWLPFLDVRWTVTEPDVALRITQRGRTADETWTPVRRGTPERVVRWFTVGDAFGLCAMEVRVVSPLDARFLPDEGSLRRVEVVQGLASGDQIAHPEGRPEGDLQDMRQYGAGDPIRYVLWKVFAKSRTLVVRKPERALSPVTRTAAFLVVGPGDQAAAGTAQTAVSTGALGDEWVFGCDGTSEVARTRQEALPLIVQSARHPLDAGGEGLARFLEAADRPRRIIVFAPALAGPWVETVAGFGATVHLELILCADHIRPEGLRYDVKRLVLLPATDGRAGVVVTDRAALTRLCQRLAGVGELKIVDRRAGVVYAGAHIARLTRGAA